MDHNPSPALTSFQLPISGMSCAACAAGVERQLNGVEGVQNARVNFATETASVATSAGVSTSDLVDAVTQGGYSVLIETRELAIEGMTCASCVAPIEGAISSLPGVVSAGVNFASETATVHLLAGAKTETIISAIERAGYSAHSVGSPESKGAAVAKQGSEVILLLGTAALTAPLLAPMVLMPLGIRWELGGMIQLALAAPVQFIGGARFYRGAYRAIVARAANMDVLVAMGTSAAFGLSLFHLFRGGHLYFESAAAIIFFVLLGKWLESRAKKSTSMAIQALIDLRPAVARLKEESGERKVPAEEVRRGQLVLIRPGERVPVDGLVVAGSSNCNESLITGESLPVAKEVGATVIGGSINEDGFLEVEATHVGAESALSRIQKMVSDAQGSKAPIQRTVDRVAAIFVPIVLLLSLLTFIGWATFGEATEDALIASVSVLVIACPCALGLATPAALMTGTGAAARAGILIRNAEALELARSINTVAFDKTGTLTLGKPMVLGVAGKDPEGLVRQAASVQAGSEHPIGAAIREYAKAQRIRTSSTTNFRVLAGRGVEAVLDEGTVTVGSPRWLSERGLPTGEFREVTENWESEGRTVVWVTRDDEVLGALSVGDAIRDGAKSAIRRLQDEGISAVLLTGDNKRVAAKVADELGMDDVRAEVLPEEKAAVIDELRDGEQVVAMVGDGINDAPALAVADVGFAMGTGTDVALSTAGVTLMRPEPSLVAEAVRISRATSIKIRQNLFWAFAFNVVGIPLAALGYLTPMVAGGAMALSSVSVLGNALLLARWRPRE